jgi:hypothetical protein
VATEFLYIEDIGLGEKGQFTDLQDQVIGNLFKLYPWEYMLREMFSTKLEDAGVRWLEPAWKSIISNKALLPMLWEMFPNHPNLLAAYFSEDAHPEMEKYVIKPIFSREGANVSIVENGKVLEAVEGPYGEEGTIVRSSIPAEVWRQLHADWQLAHQRSACRDWHSRRPGADHPGSVALLSAHFRRVTLPRRHRLLPGFCFLRRQSHRQHTQRAHLDSIDRDRIGSSPSHAPSTYSSGRK